MCKQRSRLSSAQLDSTVWKLNIRDVDENVNVYVATLPVCLTLLLFCFIFSLNLLRFFILKYFLALFFGLSVLFFFSWSLFYFQSTFICLMFMSYQLFPILTLCLFCSFVDFLRPQPWLVLLSSLNWRVLKARDWIFFALVSSSIVATVKLLWTGERALNSEASILLLFLFALL